MVTLPAKKEEAGPTPKTSNRHPSNRLSKSVPRGHTALGKCQSTLVTSSWLWQSRRINDLGRRRADTRIPLKLIWDKAHNVESVHYSL